MALLRGTVKAAISRHEAVTLMSTPHWLLSTAIGEYDVDLLRVLATGCISGTGILEEQNPGVPLCRGEGANSSYLQYPDTERESFEGDWASTCSLSLRLGLVYLLVIMSLAYKAGSTRSLRKWSFSMP